MSYKKIYVKNFGEIEKDFEIHHIDLNKKNNNPYNLVSIPKNLHKEYHKFLNSNRNLKEKESHKINIYGFGNGFFLEQLEQLEKFLSEINFYILKRNDKEMIK